MKEQDRELFNNFKGYGKAREVSFCRKELEFDSNKIAKVCLLSDIHFGFKSSDFEAVKRLRDHCLKENIYICLGGDLVEASTRYSIGAGVYEQEINPNEQFLYLLDFFEPLFDQGLLISTIRGNHEDRFRKNVGIDLASIFAWIYRLSYLGSGGFHYFKVGGESYSIYYEHGYGGARFLHTKMKKVVDASRRIEGFDAFCWGHVHELIWWNEMKQMINKKKRGVTESERLFIITGHYLRPGGYIKEQAFPTTKLGSPILHLSSKEHKIEVGYFYA